MSWHQSGACVHLCCPTICIKSYRKAPAGGGCQKSNQLLHANSILHQRDAWRGSSTKTGPGSNASNVSGSCRHCWSIGLLVGGGKADMGATGGFTLLLLLLLLLLHWSCWRRCHRTMLCFKGLSSTFNSSRCP
jgi:hypothetical protein